MNPNHLALSIPSEMMPQMANTLENWGKRGRWLFYEEPHDEEREYILAPEDAEYTKGDYLKGDYVSFKERIHETYKDWEQRRKEKGLHVPPRKHGIC